MCCKEKARGFRNYPYQNSGKTPAKNRPKTQARECPSAVIILKAVLKQKYQKRGGKSLEALIIVPRFDIHPEIEYNTLCPVAQNEIR